MSCGCPVCYVCLLFDTHLGNAGLKREWLIGQQLNRLSKDGKDLPGACSGLPVLLDTFV